MARIVPSARPETTARPWAPPQGSSVRLGSTVLLGHLSQSHAQWERTAQALVFRTQGSAQTVPRVGFAGRMASPVQVTCRCATQASFATLGQTDQSLSMGSKVAGVPREAHALLVQLLLKNVLLASSTPTWVEN